MRSGRGGDGRREEMRQERRENIGREARELVNEVVDWLADRWMSCISK